MVSLPNSNGIKFQIYDLHNSFGITVMIIALIRIYWRARNGWPTSLGAQKTWETRAKIAAHWTLILATLSMPISGILMRIGAGWGVKYFGIVLSPFTRVDNVASYPLLDELGLSLHYYGGRVLIAVLILHVLAALKHHFIDRDGTLRRMIGKPITGT
jgi:cytochrome b561